jgi:hypothetical protein
MGLDSLAKLGEFVVGVLVVVTLLYPAYLPAPSGKTAGRGVKSSTAFARRAG